MDSLYEILRRPWAVLGASVGVLVVQVRGIVPHMAASCFVRDRYCFALR